MKEKAEAGLQCFRNREHTVFKAMGLGEGGYVGVSPGGEEEKSRPWTREHLEVMKTHQKELKRSSQRRRK